LVSIRSVERPGPEVVQLAEEMIVEIEGLRPWELPDECDANFNEWLIEERLRIFKCPGSAAS